MTSQPDNSGKQPTLHLFDGELEHLHCLILEMADLLLYQLEQAMQALNDGDMELALKVISRDKEIDNFEIKIDSEVLVVLARLCPVANVLRTVISTSKIAAELEKIGDEITDFAKLILVLFEPRSSAPSPKLLADIIKIGHLVKTMLVNLMVAFRYKESDRAYSILQHGSDCENELQQGLKHQLAGVGKDARLIGLALEIMQIMKTLECCGEHCRNIAENMIFMIDGVDVRHCR